MPFARSRGIRNWTPGPKSTYKPKYAKMVLEQAAEGKSLVSFAASVGVCQQTLGNWRNRFPEFDNACEEAKVACAAWWEEKARTAGDGGNPAKADRLIMFMLKNHAPDQYKDRQEVEHTGMVEFASRLANARQRLQTIEGSAEDVTGQRALPAE